MSRAFRIRLLSIVALVALLGAGTFERVHEHEAGGTHGAAVDCHVCLGHDRSAGPPASFVPPARMAPVVARLLALDPGVRLPLELLETRAPRGPPAFSFVLR